MGKPGDSSPNPHRFCEHTIMTGHDDSGRHEAVVRWVVISHCRS